MKTPRIGGREGVWLVALLALHLLATAVFLSPTEVFVDQPLFHIDYPVHTHRVAVYGEGFRVGGLPWGWDPAVGAGLVVSPYRDIGAKPLQVLGLLLPGVEAATTVRLFLFATVLLFPVSCLLSARLLGLGFEAIFWITASAVAALWLGWTVQLYLGWGLVSFVAAAAFTPLVLALFTRFCRSPAMATYLGFAGSLALILLLHIQGPWPLSLPLVLLVLTVRPLPWRWRLAALLAPVLAIAVNAFWLIPAYRGSKMPFEPLDPLADYPDVKHLTLGALSEFTAQIDAAWVVTRLVFLVLAAVGVGALSKRSSPLAAWSFALATGWTFCLSVFGSFMPFFERYQPVRFVVPGLVLLAVPLGSGIASTIERWKIDTRWFRAGFLVAAIVLAMATFRGPEPLPLPPEPDALQEFIAAETSPNARLAIQSLDGIDEGGFEGRAMALAYDREVIGCTYPKVAMPAQFLGDRMLGKLFDQWTPPALATALGRWGIDWVFTRTAEAEELIGRAVGSPGIPVGPYQAFQLSTDSGRFLIGSGTVRAGVNRLELSNLEPEDGQIVLRYRFHPAWKAIPAVELTPYPVPEDMAGFIRLTDPPPSLTLEFDTAAMLTAEWPASGP